MSFNQFAWTNYKETQRGQHTLRVFEEDSVNEILALFDTNGKQEPPFQLAINIGEVIKVTELLDAFCVKPVLLDPETLTLEEAQELFVNIATEGVSLQYEDGVEDIVNLDDLLHHIPSISTWLFTGYNTFFKPYYFQHNFRLLTRISDAFGLSLPPVPLKRYWPERLYYYFELCVAFAEFEEKHNLSPAEMCAFLYDFAPRYVEIVGNSTAPLPQPTQVWMIGANKPGGDFDFLDNATPESTHFWQGNEDVHRGDVLIMYCKSPRSYIHSIWRATTDGISDPFFHFYGSVYIGHGKRIPPITKHELEADPHFKAHPLVRRNLQGLNGRPLTSEDYKRLQQLIAEKGGKTEQLLQLYGYTLQQHESLSTEREVEIQLIEPLLERLGYSNQDWVRQLSLRMGRGERNYPDYAFLEDRTPGYERAKMLIESKLMIRTNRELEDTFKQVWSYGQRLSASILIIADTEAIWVYEKHNDAFDRTRYTKLFWQQLKEPDAFTQLKRLIGNN